MKNSKLQTKRKTQKGFRAMYARTVGKKVKATAAANADELDGDVPNVGIGKALTVILILHVLAIIAIYVGTQWRGGDDENANNAVALDLSNKSADETSEAVNDNAGVVTLDTPSSYNLNGTSDNGSVNADGMNTTPSQSPDLTVEPRKKTPRVIKPRRNPNEVQPMVQSTAVVLMDYKIKAGDTFYRLAKEFNCSQQEIIDVNPNVNASRLKIGMTVKVPQK